MIKAPALDIVLDPDASTDLMPKLSPEIQARIGKELSSVYQDAVAPDLAKDIDDAFSGARAGHLVRHVFNDAAMPLWQAFASQVPHYGSREEEDILRAERPYLESVGRELRARAQGGSVNLIEFGTGASLDTKTAPTIEALKPDDYTAVDYAAGAAYEAGIHISGKFGQAVRPHIRMMDFTKSDLRLPDAGAQIFVMYGQTLGNCEGFSSQPLTEPVNKTIANIRRHMKEGDYLMVGLLRDQKMEEAYRHDLFRAFHAQFPHYLKQTLHAGAHVVPEDFEFFVKWLPGMSNHIFGYTARNNGWIQPLKDGPKYHYKQGHVMMMTCNSARFTQRFLNDMASANAMRERRVLTNGKNRTFIHVYQAV